MNILIDKIDNSTATLLVDGHKKHYGTHPKYYVNSSLTFFQDGAQHTYKFKHGLDNGKRSLYNAKFNKFPIGLVPHVYNMLKKQYPQANLKLSPNLSATFQRDGGKVTHEEVEEYIKSIDLPFPPRDYQMKMIVDAINKRRRTFSACTGSGKSLVIYIVSRWFLEKEDKDMLVVVPSMSLVEQIYSDFIDYGWNDIENHCSRLHSQVKKPTKSELKELAKYEITPDNLLKRIVISTWQSLAPKKKEFFKRFEGVICDEAHSARADVLSNIIQTCKNASIRIGVSGTIPTINGLDGNVIVGSLGPTDHIVSPRDLIDRGLLTETRIVAIKIPYDEYSIKASKRMKYADEVEATSLCGSTEKLIENLLKHDKIKTTENTVVLVKHIELLKRIVNLINEKFPNYKAVEYHGAVNAAKREAIRSQVEEDSGYIVVSTYGTMKQGVNIKRINNIVFGQGSSSLITVKQSIGRGLRLHPEKPILTIYDFIDDLSYKTRYGNLRENYAIRHYKERLVYYNDDDYPVKEFNAPFVASFSDIKV